ncbi:Protein of unknown function [Pyronema omphalodes CBS 100304]|uniref:Uncharacterized protein n=1 Tax=Pyronema omphalodes (strain CBS 100304) TaxID=1076935 RepID=U4LNZ7_PYROM|nr:Protein of unknown function [Pyronema omphalodes CBS 100304]
MAFYRGKIFLLARKIHGQPDGKYFFWYAKPDKIIPSVSTNAIISQLLAGCCYLVAIDSAAAAAPVGARPAKPRTSRATERETTSHSLLSNQTEPTLSSRVTTEAPRRQEPQSIRPGYRGSGERASSAFVVQGEEGLAATLEEVFQGR